MIILTLSDDLFFSCYTQCRYECGISKPTVNIRDIEREGIISSLCLHFVVLSAKAELDDLVDGLKSLEILSLVRNNPQVARQLFVKGTPKPLTADSIYDMFTPVLSPQMSNLREKEEAQLLNWSNFLGFVEGTFTYSIMLMQIQGV